MDYKIFVADDFQTYCNSLLYPSGTEIASISCEIDDELRWVSLQTCGNVSIRFRGNVYKDVSQFPSELVSVLRDGGQALYKMEDSGDLEIVENNWWEWCFSNGDGVILGCDPCEHDDICELIGDMVRMVLEM